VRHLDASSYTAAHHWPSSAQSALSAQGPPVPDRPHLPLDLLQCPETQSASKAQSAPSATLPHVSLTGLLQGGGCTSGESEASGHARSGA
jgi:hypothetical protein